LPKQFICGKNFLKQYYQRAKKINDADKSKEVLKLFAKPKLDCLLKEEKFKIQQKKESLYTYILKNAEEIEDVLKKLEKESFYCYDIKEKNLNSFVSVNNYKFIDFNSSLLLYLKIYKEYEKERVIGIFISKKENEFYKISGGVY